MNHPADRERCKEGMLHMVDSCEGEKDYGKGIHSIYISEHHVVLLAAPSRIG
jgi:hypothetical protein